MAEIRADAVEVVKLHRAQCRLPSCDWTGELHDNYQDANAERLDHLESHRSE